MSRHGHGPEVTNPAASRHVAAEQVVVHAEEGPHGTGARTAAERMVQVNTIHREVMT